MEPDGAPGTKWTRDQTIAALSLYCQIPFGQMNSSNARVKELAAAIGRSPASIAMKLGNLASFDPFHKARGIGGLPNTSALDREVWEEFYGRWGELAKAYVAPITEPIESLDLPAETTKEALTVVRVGQRFFRNAVLSSYGGECCITGMREPRLLRASHIIPWAEREDTRLDPSNGLCLNALHDAAFDRGLITIADDWTLRVADSVRGSMPEETCERFFLKYQGRPVTKPERWKPASAYLAHHREHIFVPD